MLAAGFTLLAILITRVQVTLLVGDIASALASADADRVYYEEQLNSCKVSHALAHYGDTRNRKKFDVTFCRLDTIHECDIQTDRRTDRQTTHSVAR